MLGMPWGEVTRVELAQPHPSAGSIKGKSKLYCSTLVNLLLVILISFIINYLIYFIISTTVHAIEKKNLVEKLFCKLALFINYVTD